ncbi:MAG TPA: tetratricopeptide repeat protein, partial [Tepidisphaeraceae bacterium]|nr:tetratricopeptide repeat protein [Tepidisphaeraceae bacterium]
LAVAAKPAYVEGLYLQHRNVEALQAADRYLAPGNDLRSEQRSLVSYYRGMILLDLGRVKDAIAVLKAATEQTRTRKIAIINLFEAQLRDDDCVAAEATLNDITRNYHNTLGRLARLKAELAHAKETHGILPLNEAPRVSNRLSDGSERREPVIGVTEDRHATR